MPTGGDRGGAANQDAATDQGAGEQPISQEEAIAATQWRILRELVLVALLRPLGKRSTDLTLEQQNEILEPYVSAMVGSAGMLRECGQQFYLLGVQRVHVALHGQPGVDHEMLDAAVEFHSNQPALAAFEDDEPFILER